MSEPDAELRRLVAHEHGLDEEAAKILTGATLDELDASASVLARLIGRRHEQETTVTTPSPFADVIAATQRRKMAITALFAGRPLPPRDERGRWRPAADFHAGARRPAPRPAPSHDTWLADLLRSRRADAGGRF
jgi:hypothetical protein